MAPILFIITSALILCAKQSHSRPVDCSQGHIFDHERLDVSRLEVGAESRAMTARGASNEHRVDGQRQWRQRQLRIRVWRWPEPPPTERAEPALPSQSPSKPPPPDPSAPYPPSLPTLPPSTPNPKAPPKPRAPRKPLRPKPPPPPVPSPRRLLTSTPRAPPPPAVPIPPSPPPPLPPLEPTSPAPPPPSPAPPPSPPPLSSPPPPARKPPLPPKPPPPKQPFPRPSPPSPAPPPPAPAPPPPARPPSSPSAPPPWLPRSPLLSESTPLSIAEDIDSNLGGGNCSDAQAVFSATNTYRSWHLAPPLTWDAGLAADAQAYAEVLAAQQCELVHAAVGGESLYNLETFPKPDWSCKRAIDSWYNEVKLYDFATATPYDINTSRGTGHFAQLVWRSSALFGCGVGKADVPMARMPGGMGGCKVVVCRYRSGVKASNAQFLFNVLPRSSSGSS